MNFYFIRYYPQNLQPISVKELLIQLLIPRKWRHYLRINKKININGTYRHFNSLVYPGEKISFDFDHVNSQQQSYPPSANFPDIQYEDEDLLVINKPAGQKTHPNLNETDTALNDCATYLKKSPFIVNRFDKLTSGLLLVAKNPVIVPLLNRQLTNKTFHREYLAQVENSQNLPDKGTIDLPLGKDPNDQRKRMVTKTGLRAITNYQVLKQQPNGTALVKLDLKTGRTHQIRVHLAAINCPIVGDPLYNPNLKPNSSLKLTAYQLSFLRPLGFNRITVNLNKNKTHDILK